MFTSAASLLVKTKWVKLMLTTSRPLHTVIDFSAIFSPRGRRAEQMLGFYRKRGKIDQIFIQMAKSELCVPRGPFPDEYRWLESIQAHRLPEIEVQSQTQLLYRIWYKIIVFWKTNFFPNFPSFMLVLTLLFQFYSILFHICLKSLYCIFPCCWRDCWLIWKKME